MTSPLLAIKDLDAYYGQVRALHAVSLTVAAGSITALMGANGAGKTTLTKTIAGLLPARSGSLEFEGEAITALPSNQRVDRGIALVPEGRLVFPDLTVEQNLWLGAYVKRARRFRDSRLEEMYTLFPRLRERRKQYARTLSGGEQQMLALARGVMSGPKLLILDEPSLGLAPQIVKLLFSMIAEIRARGVTILIVEQNLHATLKVADYAYVLENGGIVRAGEGRALLEDPTIKAHYLGL